LKVDPKRQQEQRDRIIQAAAKFIAAHGYHGMSMRALAKATGKSLSTYYNYFSSKEDVLFVLQKEAFEALISIVNEALSGVSDPAVRLYLFILNHVRYFVDHPDVMRVLVHEAAALPARRRRAVRRVKEEYYRVGNEIVRALVEQGDAQAETEGREVEDEIELERATYSIFGMLNWVYGWYEPSRHGAPEEVARTIHGIALRGLVAGCPSGSLQESVEAYLNSAGAPP